MTYRREPARIPRVCDGCTVGARTNQNRSSAAVIVWHPSSFLNSKNGGFQVWSASPGTGRIVLPMRLGFAPFRGFKSPSLRGSWPSPLDARGEGPASSPRDLPSERAPPRGDRPSRFPQQRQSAWFTSNVGRCLSTALPATWSAKRRERTEPTSVRVARGSGICRRRRQWSAKKISLTSRAA